MIVLFRDFNEIIFLLGGSHEVPYLQVFLTTNEIFQPVRSCFETVPSVLFRSGLTNIKNIEHFEYEQYECWEEGKPVAKRW